MFAWSLSCLIVFKFRLCFVILDFRADLSVHPMPDSRQSQSQLHLKILIVWTGEPKHPFPTFLSGTATVIFSEHESNNCLVWTWRYKTGSGVPSYIKSFSNVAVVPADEVSWMAHMVVIIRSRFCLLFLHQ
jgi:hypothetical protein